MAYLTTADLQARMSAADYARAFDRDGDGDPTKIANNATQAIKEATSWINVRLGEAFGPLVALDANGALVDEYVKSQLCAVAIWSAVRYSPLAVGDPKSPYRQAFLDAEAFVERLRKDDGARLQTSAGGLAQPVARVANDITSDGTPTNPFARARDGLDGSGY
jgi:hypothetical protein